MKPHNPQIRGGDAYLGPVLRLVDFLCIAGGLYLALHCQPDASSAQFVAGTAAAILTFGVLAEVTGMYRGWRGSGFFREFGNATLTWVLTAVGLMIAGLITQYDHNFYRSSFFTWFLVAICLMGLVRAISRIVTANLHARGINTRNCAIVGVNDLGIQLAQSIVASPHLGMTLLGFFDDRPVERTPSLSDTLSSRIGDIDELIQLAKNGEVGTVYIAFPMRAENRIRDLLDHLADSTASVYIVPDFFVFEMLHSRWRNIHGVPVVSIYESPVYGVDGAVKRCADLLFASLAMVIFSIPMLLIAILIKLTSPGPVFFRQRRYGLDGHEIKVWKFRSMRVCEDGDRVVQASKTDDRVTSFGQFIRKTSLDELPQLFNVLAGNMSMVGPRPHASAHNEEYRKQIKGYMLRHKVKPGITGLAQVKGYRGETDTLEKMEKRIECDHEYIRDWSLWMDLRILFRTLFVAFNDDNAY